GKPDLLHAGDPPIGANLPGMKVEPITNEQVAALWQALGFGAAQTITVPQRGCSNACFLVNADRVVRFQVTELPRHKFRTEKIAYDLLRGSELPVPEVLVLDESKTLVPCAFLITTRLPGETVYDSWDGLDERTREQLAFEAGRCQALLHQHTLPAFGGLSQLADGGFPTWRAYLEDYVGRNARQARDEGLLDTTTTTRIEQLLVRFQPLMDAVTTGSLLHRDYHFENLLQQEGKITGIIDFEWAMSGDPVFDCRIDGTLAGCPGSVEPFYAGYASISPLSEHHRLKAEFYCLLLCLESIAWWGKDPEAADWMPEEYQSLFALLPALEQAI
ncbi:MAG TPA: aminoglycoside phosphotransferase family protein, partial [Chthonomonadaceae bacterium]|nr:aminoglycoside phosphotransferase family protein [Chthonomonadaceae bacterium]